MEITESEKSELAKFIIDKFMDYQIEVISVNGKVTREPKKVKNAIIEAWETSFRLDRKFNQSVKEKFTIKKLMKYVGWVGGALAVILMALQIAKTVGILK